MIILSSDNHNRKMPIIYINPIGGLANRMRAIASGISLARSAGCDFRIIWRVNGELMARFDDIFEIPELLRGKLHHPGPAEYSLLWSMPRKKNLYVTRATLKRFHPVLLDCSPDFSRMIDKEGAFTDSVAKDCSHGRNAYIQSGVVFHYFTEEEYRNLFQPHRELAARAESVRSELGTDYIGIHIRRTDNKEAISNSPDSLFIREIENILNRAPQTKFYLASDSQAVKHKIADRFGGDVIHFNRSEAKRNTLEGMQDAMVEMMILAGAREIIGSHYSSYSEAAAMLGNVPLRQLRAGKH